MGSRMATASTSASTSRPRALGFAPVLLAAFVVLTPASPALAGRLESFRGHFGLGYAKLLNPDSPAGSLSASAGVDYPVRPALRAGVDVGFFLLGSRVVDSGSLSAGVDYSAFEVMALAHWTPPGGPIALISAGPGLLHASASLSSSAPAAFGGVAVGETALGAGVGLSVLPRRDSLVKAGAEIGVRTAWLERRTWTIAFARGVVHY